MRNLSIPDAVLLIKLIEICLLANNASCHNLKCYVCGEGENVQSCDDFNATNEHLFIRDCPPDFKSCRIDTNEYFVSRMCDKMRFNDCKIANQVEYCYCSESLCNGVKISLTVPNDDEDFIEGSGSGDQRKLWNASVVTNTSVTTFVNRANTSNSIFTFVVGVILLI